MTQKNRQDQLFVGDIECDGAARFDGEFNLGGTAVTATADEINRAADVSDQLVAAGATLTLTEALHAGKTIALDTLAGSTVTLPAATGSGAKYRFIVVAAATSNAHVIQVANATDEYAGLVLQVDTDTSDALAAYPALDADGFDTVTLNGTTTGGLPGDEIIIQDIAAGVFLLQGKTNASGTVATPLTAAVS